MEGTKGNKDYQEVVDTLRSGLYNGAKAKNLRKSHLVQRYRSQRDSMAVDDVFLTNHNRLVVQEAARVKVLSTLHIQHTEVIKTLMDARQLYFWPGKTRDIEMMYVNCAEFLACLLAQTLEPYIATEVTHPFEKNSASILASRKTKTTLSVLIGTQGGPWWPIH